MPSDDGSGNGQDCSGEPGDRATCKGDLHFAALHPFARSFCKNQVVRARWLQSSEMNCGQQSQPTARALRSVLALLLLEIFQSLHKERSIVEGSRTKVLDDKKNAGRPLPKRLMRYGSLQNTTGRSSTELKLDGLKI